jgi:hypothetical protein
LIADKVSTAVTKPFAGTADYLGEAVRADAPKELRLARAFALTTIGPYDPVAAAQALISEADVEHPWGRGCAQSYGKTED